MSFAPDPTRPDPQAAPVEPPTFTLDRMEAAARLAETPPPFCRHCQMQGVVVQRGEMGRVQVLGFKHADGCPDAD